VRLPQANVPALLAVWARFVEELTRTGPAAGAAADLREQVAVRHEIAQRLRLRPASAETRDLLREFDEAYREVTSPADTCLLGDERAAVEGWTPAREWYFWRYAAPPGPTGE
jgi:hypothetical protein